jgi:hypothetical protein
MWEVVHGFRKVKSQSVFQKFLIDFDKRYQGINVAAWRRIHMPNANAIPAPESLWGSRQATSSSCRPVAHLPELHFTHELPQDNEIKLPNIQLSVIDSRATILRCPYDGTTKPFGCALPSLSNRKTCRGCVSAQCQEESKAFRSANPAHFKAVRIC